MSALPVLPLPVTIEEFDRLEWPEDTEYELFEGEVLEVSHPALSHRLIQERLRDLLNETSGTKTVHMELAWQITATPPQTKRSADVAVLSPDRLRDAIRRKVIDGPPDLVVEILSPSNSGSSLNRLEKLCLANGSIEFWTVDPETRTIRIRAAGSHVVHV
ncbi:MAG: Uma2 family endonuclease [Bryobacteraceae bacterium]|nr:Uma2 family endonuclease [Bryobacteraceae bacterium]